MRHQIPDMSSIPESRRTQNAVKSAEVDPAMHVPLPTVEDLVKNRGMKVSQVDVAWSLEGHRSEQV